LFNNHFKSAWLQSPEALEIVGDGNNFIPTVHVSDVARLVKTVTNKPNPEHKYILAVDGTMYRSNKEESTQSNIIKHISEDIGTGKVINNLNSGNDNMKSIEHKAFKIDLQLVPSNLMEYYTNDEPPKGFNWHCKDGIAANLPKILAEFC